MTIDVGNTAYDRNSLDDGFPKEAPVAESSGGFASNPERIDGYKLRVRSASFDDHFSQATLFWKSMSPPEQQHIIDAFSFELAKLTRPEIRTRVIEQMLANVDDALTAAVCANLGLPAPVEPIADAAGNGKRANGKRTNGNSSTANGAGSTTTASGERNVDASPALSLLNQEIGIHGVKGRKVAILAADGVIAKDVRELRDALSEAGIDVHVIAPHLGALEGEDGKLDVDHYMVTRPSVIYDAIVIADGATSVATLDRQGTTVSFISDAYRHGKAVAASGAAVALLTNIGIATDEPIEGVVLGDSAKALIAPFIDAISRHRSWSRPPLRSLALR